MSPLGELLHRYTVRVGPITQEDGGGFRATYEELGLSVAGYGDTASAAIAQLSEVAQESLADEPAASMPLPRCEPSWGRYSGRVTLRVPKALHAQLDRLADEQGVSLNQFMSSALQSAASAMLAGLEFGPTTAARAGGAKP